jgi:branched-chain amino acid aminotransferase
VHANLLHNCDIRETSEPLLLPGQVGFLNGWGVFSTIRVAEGVLFAFERHYRRMQIDAERIHVPFPYSEKQLLAFLQSLIEANQAYNATLRVAIVRNRGGFFEAPHLTRDADLIAFTAGLNNWGEGVKLSYKAHARYGASPFAGTKITSWAQNLTWYEEAHELGFDEFVLLNEEGQVSECTSANIFAIYDDQVWTPPLATSGCLPGVTRAIFLEEISVPGLQISEHPLTPSELEEADQVFITSTTRDLLPVLEIDHAPLKQTPRTLRALRDGFAAYRSEYVSSRLADSMILA